MQRLRGKETLLHTVSTMMATTIESGTYLAYDSELQVEIGQEWTDRRCNDSPA